ncbi:MAG TPA: FHA domain-containing protein [Rhodanobacteraceae bacterium]|nr:FHA domain-containing protein [Rhodanobacteraceae bacterium]
MPAKLSIHVPTQAVTIRVLPDGTDLTLGRAPENDCVLAHDSVSRRHARMSNTPDGRWIVEDLGSKNGIRVEGSRVEHHELTANQWVAIGDVFCEFERVGEEAVEHLRSRAEHRRQSSQLWIDRIATTDNVDKLMDTLLGGIMDIAECRRGFLLVMDVAQQLRVRACHAIDADDLSGAAFSGSRSAVDRSIRERRAVYLSDRRDHDWLNDQASVVAGGIRALASLPLQHDGRLLGVAYADTDDEAKIFSELDADLLEAFAQRASTALAAIEIDSTLSRMESAFADTGGGASQRSRVAPAWHEGPARRDALEGQRG